MIEEKITIVINGKKMNEIRLDEIKSMDIKSIIMREAQKSSEIMSAEKIFVHINGKDVKPRDVENISAETIHTIEIFDKEHLNR